MIESQIRRHGAAAGVFLLLAVLLTWPLAAQLTTRVPSDNGDPLLSIWTLWWNARHVPFTDAWWHGAIFAPAPDALTYSDHRVGLGLIATPLLWLGVSPLAAYNVTFLASYVLSGWSMYALAFVLTRRRDAALLAGIAFAFHPFRADHLPHLELLSSYWLPLALLALHQWTDTRRPRWLVATAVALTLQALTCGYYFVYSAVLVGVWLVWFVPWRLPVRQYAALGLALVAPVLLLAPVLWRYHVAHATLGLSRSVAEVEQLSADLAAFLTAPARLSLWGWLQAWPSPEGALFPGMTLVALIGAAVLTARRRAADAATTGGTRRWAAWRRTCLALAGVAFAAALLPVSGHPVDVAVGPVRLSIHEAFKPISVAVLLLLVAGLGSPALHAAWRGRSPAAFYLLATLVMWACALGPTARLFGERVLYKPPYAWLMLLPGFADEFRAPARYAMLAALTMSVAAALAFTRLSASWTRGRRVLAAVLLVAGVLAEGSVLPFPLVSPPSMLDVPAGVPADAVILEWPMGVEPDAAAMYRATAHGHAVANGLSGYQPPHLTLLRAALDDEQFAVFDGLATDVPLALFLDRASTPAHWPAALAATTAARPLASTSTHDLLLRPPLPAPPWTPPDASLAVPVTALAASDNPALIGQAVDGRPGTVWGTPGAQRGGETVTITLAEQTAVSAVWLSFAGHAAGFPRALSVRVSDDGEAWREVWAGPTARLAMTTVLADPRLVRMPVRFAPTPARFVRLVQTARANEAGWVIAELSVLR